MEQSINEEEKKYDRVAVVAGYVDVKKLAKEKADKLKSVEDQTVINKTDETT